MLGLQISYMLNNQAASSQTKTPTDYLSTADNNLPIKCACFCQRADKSIDISSPKKPRYVGELQ